MDQPEKRLKRRKGDTTKFVLCFLRLFVANVFIGAIHAIHG
jgi:hypothetical protein